MEITKELLIKDDLIESLIHEQTVKLRWEIEDVNYSEDQASFRTLPEKAKILTIYYLIFTLIGDDIVMDETEDSIINEAPEKHVSFLRYKQANEQTHARTYREMLLALLSVDQILDYAKNIVDSKPMKRKIVWLNENLRKCQTYADKNIVLSIAEGIFFRSVFLHFDWLNTSGLHNPLPGCVHGNKFIRDDENFHQTALIKLAYQAGNITLTNVVDILADAVDVEIEVTKYIFEEILHVDSYSVSENTSVTGVEITRNYIRTLGNQWLRHFSRITHRQIDQKLDADTLPAYCHGVTCRTNNFYEKDASSYHSTLRRVKVEILNPEDW